MFSFEIYFFKPIIGHFDQDVDSVECRNQKPDRVETIVKFIITDWDGSSEEYRRIFPGSLRLWVVLVLRSVENCLDQR